MSEFAQEIRKIIVKEVESRATTFLGIVRDYDHKTRTCVVEISNPTGAGRVLLHNKSVPEAPGGVIPGKVRIGSTVLMACPMGQYTHAEIASIKPFGELFVIPDRVDQDNLPRGGKTIAVAGRLRT